MDFETRIAPIPVGRFQFQIEELVSFEASVDALYAKLVEEGRPESLDGLCPYFGVCWPAAKALSRWLFEHFQETLAGKQVLELGCGLALPSFTAAALGAKTTATDNHPYVRDFFERNRQRNQLSTVEFVDFDWRSPKGSLPDVDWVIASDVLYDAPSADSLADFLTTHLGSRTRAAIVDPDRPFLERFLDRVESNGMPAMKHELPAEENAHRLYLVEIASREE